MTKQQKIQAAIDALPNATEGDWLVRRLNFPVVFAKREDGEDTRDEICDSAGDVDILTAAKDLAEEVVRLRGLVQSAYREGHCAGGDVGSWFRCWGESYSKTDLEGGS